MESGDMIEMKGKQILKNSQQKACVIMVGSTNTGKSTTVNIMTKSKECIVGKDNQCDPCTQKLKLVDKNSELAYMDNPGWDDPRKSNRETFRSILVELKERGGQVKAVIWCMEPSKVVNDSLKTQSRLIQHFLGKEIWSNVIILAMGGLKKHTPEVRCQGATSAAKELQPNLDFTGRLISYELGENMTTEEQAHTTIQNVLNTLQPKMVEFTGAGHACQRCGQEGDLRLMTDMCHLEKGCGHTKDLLTRFTKGQVWVGLAVAAAATTGVTLATVFGSPFSLIIVPFTLPCLWPAISRGCCGRCSCGRDCMERSNPAASGEASCQSALAYVSPREEWPCCEKSRGDQGCKDVCIALRTKGIKCNGRGEWEKKVRWGEKSGCVYIVDEIPKRKANEEGPVFIYASGIEHEPKLKGKK